MLQPSAATAIMQAFSNNAGRMASEPVDFSAGAAEPQDGAEVIPIVSPTIVAFIGRTERGPLNEPVVVKRFEDFSRIFGGHVSFSFVSLAVQHFFWHGGECAVIVRVANRATRATLDIAAGREVLRLQARQPGSREHLRVSVDYDRVERTPDKFNLVIQRVSRAGSQLVDDQEVFEGLSMDPTDERFIVDALQDSELVRLVGPLPSYRPSATAPPNPGKPIPYITVKQPGSDGEELTDYDVIGSNAEGTGLFALDALPRVDLVCVPSPPGRDLGSTSFLAATRYCERRRALLVWDPPWVWTSADAAVLALRTTAHASRHALTYFPRVRPRGDLGRYESGIPACGAVAGMIARCDQGGVWHRMPPVDTTLKGGLAPLVEVEPPQAAVLQRMGVNTFIRIQPGVVALHGNVSFAGTTTIDALWQNLSASRLAAFVVRSIETETRWVFTAGQPDQLAAELERQVWVFLSRLKQHGAFAGTTPDQAFFVRTSAAPEQGGDGRDVAISLRIGFAPRAPSEFLTYDFRYHAASLTTEVRPVRDAERHLG
jgi:Bacteriophage tail sheath protein